MFSITFRQQLLEVLLECLLQIDADNIGIYDRFCDRLETEMFPYIITHEKSNEEEQFTNKDALIELKLPYMAIVEQRIE